MTWHPTTNRIQFCHLTKEEQDALESWPQGLQYFNESIGWTDCISTYWVNHCVYRGKPALVVTSVWFNHHNDGMSGPYRTREWADQCSACGRIDVLRIDTCNGVSTAHLEGLKDD